MGRIQLTQGKYTILDDEDMDWALQWLWFYCYGYARRSYRFGDGRNPKQLLLHRGILECYYGPLDPKIQVDHIDRDRLNNRKSNLRLVDNLRNSWNASRNSLNTSGYKGVSWKRDKQKWKSYITADGKQQHLGYFDCKHMAALAYNEAARQYFGQFAVLNEVKL